MTNTSTRPVDTAAQAPMVGDHLALDLLNTEAREGSDVVDHWQSGEDVHAWLKRHAVASVAALGAAEGMELLAQARTLRALARHLITQFKEGKPVDPAGLDSYLRAYLSAPQLKQDSDGKLVLTRVARAEPVAALLGPIAEAVAQLLAEGDVVLVKQCAHPECILWFYDRTKAHKRRWCSMASCGNRYKAAQFRKRSGSEAA